MIEIFCPDLYIQNLTEITPKKLESIGIRGLIIDLDNTLVSWGSDSPDPEVETWLDELGAVNIKPCILSNGLGRRVKQIARKLDLPFVSQAVKPRKKGFKRALEVLGCPRRQVAVIGDQLFTDIFGGNRIGLFTVLVVPCSNKDFMTTRAVRCIERFVLRQLKKKEMLTSPGQEPGVFR